MGAIVAIVRAMLRAVVAIDGKIVEAIGRSIVGAKVKGESTSDRRGDRAYY